MTQRPAAPDARPDAGPDAGPDARPDGEPPRDPAHPVSRTPRAPGSAPPAPDDEHLELPHEREQSTETTAPAPDPEMTQAHKDLEAGQVDTDMRATPGQDADQRSAYVPGAGVQPPSQKKKGAR